MSNTQGANSKGEAEPRDLNDVAETEISSTSNKDGLGDSALDDVSGGAWPSGTTKTGIVPPTI
ncbi:hypothetical protein QCM77_07135 [Bradyrhizobium sp. SSUT18]|uniref:hypothetical protein n=1 Tax=unclassified Bradyrhizobium TaxID=2631580 RepID=UPI002449C4C7|nr:MULTISPECIES: hypothetical protein [unclassified Bradyrhizobium]MDH2350193.1 hypothetical protein [Bradyrhizobium sp. SSUT112]MDH2399719.1 hypothetical protein [Bradyrhizobium sp. SSUT18]